MRRFEFVEGNSSKFWQIECVGCQVTTTWGRIGTGGQTKSKDYSSAAGAQVDADKHIRKKVSKG